MLRAERMVSVTTPSLFLTATTRHSESYQRKLKRESATAHARSRQRAHFYPTTFPERILLLNDKSVLRNCFAPKAHEEGSLHVLASGLGQADFCALAERQKYLPASS